MEQKDKLRVTEGAPENKAVVGFGELPLNAAASFPPADRNGLVVNQHSGVLELLQRRAGTVQAGERKTVAAMAVDQSAVRSEETVLFQHGNCN